MFTCRIKFPRHNRTWIKMYVQLQLWRNKFRPVCQTFRSKMLCCFDCSQDHKNLNIYSVKSDCTVVNKSRMSIIWQQSWELAGFLSKVYHITIQRYHISTLLVVVPYSKSTKVRDKFWFGRLRIQEHPCFSGRTLTHEMKTTSSFFWDQ